jgi:hypothetical protein
MSKKNEILKVIHQYKFETKKTELDMHEVAKWAWQRLGWRLPKPRDPLEQLARDFSKAAAQEMRHDENGRAYRALHAVTTTQNGKQLTFWIDIDEAPRRLIHKSLIQRREQMVGDAVQLSFDAEHWNTAHPAEEPIEIPMDFTEDVEWRKNGDDAKKAG